MRKVFEPKNTSEFNWFKKFTLGTLTHRHFTEHGHDSGNRNYNITKYCLDELIRTHDITLDYDDEDTDTKNSDLILDFAYICIPPYNLKGMLDDYIYPISLSFSIMCFILTFLLYSFLPQLRDLTGKFILGICSFLCIAFAALLVQHFGWRDSNVNLLTVEIFLHSR